MPRIDPWAAQYAAPKPEPVTRTLSAPGCPSLTLTLRPLGDGFATDAAYEQADRWYREHVVGTKQKPAVPFAVPKEAQKPPLAALQSIALLCAMEATEEGETEPLGLTEWLGWASRERLAPIWNQVLAFAGEVRAGGVPAEGN